MILKKKDIRSRNMAQNIEIQTVQFHPKFTITKFTLKILENLNFKGHFSAGLNFGFGFTRVSNFLQFSGSGLSGLTSEVRVFGFSGTRPGTNLHGNLNKLTKLPLMRIVRLL